MVFSPFTSSSISIESKRRVVEERFRCNSLCSMILISFGPAVLDGETLSVFYEEPTERLKLADYFSIFVKNVDYVR